jgi:DNA-binding Lrp family transcriptional regulator
METAYVFFHLQSGNKKSFIDKVKGIDGVKEARLVIGIYDAIIRIEAKSISELERIYFNQIDTINGILNSRLHFVACPRTRKIG